MSRWPEIVPVLSIDNVRLRAHREDDLDAIVEMCRDPISQRGAANIPDPYGPGDAESFLTDAVAPGWEAGTSRGWAIEAIDIEGKPRYAGNVDVRGVPDATIGFVLHPWARGRGVMSSAVRQCLRWSFTEGGVDLVTWMAGVGNAASRRVAWATGFTFRDTMPRVLRRTGPVSDAWIGTVVSGDELRPKTPWLTPTVLFGDRIKLRPFVDADIPRIVQACSDKRSSHWLSLLPAPYTEESARGYLDSMLVSQSLGRGITWCIADIETDSLLGSIALMDLEAAKASGEVGYWTHPDARGQRVMTKALNLLVEHALAPTSENGLGMRRLELLAAAANAASIEVARRAGFRQMGRERQAELLRDGTYDDLITFDLLATDERLGQHPGGN